MLLDKASLSVVEATTKEDPVYSLHGCLITKDRIVATDGRILATVENPDMPDSDFPIVEGLKNEDGNGAKLDPFVIDRDALVQIRKALPKRQHIPILEYARLDVESTNGNGSAVIGVTDLDSPQVFRPRKVEKTFPSWEKVIPSVEPVLKVGLDAKLIARLAKIAAACSTSTSNPTGLCFEFYGPDKAAKITCRSGDRFTGIIMPMALVGDDK